MKILLLCLMFSLAVATMAQTAPLVIAWQTPPGPGYPGYDGTNHSSAACGSATQYQCFLHYVLPNVSGIGIVLPWGVVDNCVTGSGAAIQCQSDAICSSYCFQWSNIDNNLWNNFVGYTGTVGNPFNFNTACAGGKPCKIVFIVWLTQDSGNLNTYGTVPNTPLYVFQESTPQDVVVCSAWTGGTSPGGTGWSGPPAIIDSAWASGGGGKDFGLWNASTAYLLPGHSSNLTFNPLASPPYTNFSGYPVMYEQPIVQGIQNFVSALALHYSSACTTSSCGNGPGIAPYVAYMRIGPSSGGENYPYCACTSSIGGSQCDTFYWPGPQGQALEAGQYSDQGYLTAWPSDGPGYVESLYQYIHSRNWAFPIDTPAHEGPAENMNTSYADTEALLASQSGLGFGMQASSIGDIVTYAAQSIPSSTANWAVHSRQFPNVPLHHLQTMNPGNPIQAAQFTICTTATCGGTVGISATGLVSCPSGSNNDCSVFCTSPHWVYISGTSNAALNGIWEVQQPQSSCASNTVQLVDAPSATSSGGVIYSGAHLPLLLPFESQNCQGSFQTICSAELWEESLDWAYGTNTAVNTIGNTSSGASDYQTAISNFLLGLPSATSMHNNMTSTANQY